MFKTDEEYSKNIGKFIQLTPNEKDEIQSLFLNRIVQVSSGLYHISLQEMMRLFSVIPVSFNFRLIEKHEEYPVKIKDFKHIDLDSAYVTISKSMNIPIIRIQINVTPDECKRANNSALHMVEDIFNNHREELIFIYFHELGHILEKDLNPLYHDMFKNAINRFFSGKIVQGIKFEEVDDKFVHQISNSCQDYYINYQIISRTSEFKKFAQIYLFDEKYKDMNKMEILDDILKKIEDSQIKIIPVPGNGTGRMKVNGEGEKLVPLDTEGNNEENPDSEDDMEIDASGNDANDASEYINETLNQTMTKLRAMGSGGAFIETFIGTPIEVDVSWTKQLITRVNNLAYMKLPRKDYGWKSPSKLMRHVATLPGITNYDLLVSMPNIYIMFDQSGSVTNNEIRQMNFIIKHLIKKRYNLTILFHDSKIETVEKVNIKNVGNLNEFVQNRYCTGGTSHKDCFEYIKNEMKDIKMMKKSIVLIFSDFYSDIDDIYKNYEWTRHIDTINLLSVGTSGKYTPPFGSSIRVK